MGVVVDAVGREGRIRGGHIDGLHAGRTQHVRRVRGQTDRAAAGLTGLHLLIGAVAAQACPLRHIDGLVRSDLDVERGIGGVDRGLGRLEQADRAVARIAEVVDRPRGPFVVQSRRARTGVRIGQAHTVLETGDECEGLERRTRLHMALRGGVEGLVEVVLATVEGFDPAVVGVDRDEPGLHALGLVRRQGLDGLLRGLHPVLVEGRDDVVAAAVELRLVDVEFPQRLTPDEVPHVALLARQRGLLVRFPHVGHVDLVGLLLADEALVDHRLDHIVETVPVGLRIVRWIGRPRALDHRGQERRLADVEVLGRLVEVVLCGHLDAVGAPAQVDRVEVVREDLVLGLLLVDLE